MAFSASGAARIDSHTQEKNISASRLAALKATWRLFQHLRRYQGSVRHSAVCRSPGLHLRWWNNTAREVRQRLLFWAFAQKNARRRPAPFFAARIPATPDRWA